MASFLALESLLRNPFFVFLVLLNLYVLAIFVLLRTGWMQRLNMSLFGPALMIKTQRGRGLLDWFAKARGFFDNAAAFGTRMTAVFMALMSLLLILQLVFIFRIPAESAPSPRLILGIPGINPLIPVGYGIVALIFAVVVHEFSHGILARAHNLRVKTMGLLLFIIPIGAFVEPDEEELKAAPRKVRLKVFGAGPTSNLFFAIFFAVLFSGALMSQTEPVPGVPISGVETDGPAYQSGLRAGQIITHVNGIPIQDPVRFSEIMSEVEPGENITIRVRNNAQAFAVTTARCIDQYSETECTAQPRGDDPLNRTVIGFNLYDTPRIRGLLVNPFSNPAGILYYISLPFAALDGQFPLAGHYQTFYEAPFDPGAFWFLVNLFYWLFWINLMLGLTNALPIVPLDGGHMFKDFLGHWLEKRNPSRPAAERDRLVSRISVFVALFLLSLVLLQFVGPHLAAIGR